eukprot:sb/3478622/
MATTRITTALPPNIDITKAELAYGEHMLPKLVSWCSLGNLINIYLTSLSKSSCFGGRTIIFSLPGWMPKASTRMPFCFAKRHSRVRIRKRHFGILTKW